MPPRFDYPATFQRIFSLLPAGTTISYLEVINNPDLPGAVSEKTKRDHLRKYIEHNPAQLKALTGLIPKPETVIALVEAEIGLITEDKLDEANQRASDVVTSITRPIVDSFVREGLSHCYDDSTCSYAVPAETLLQFLLDDFASYLKAAGNGLVSIAGSLNEKILQRAMSNAGMTLGSDFSITGTDSEADIVVHSSVATKANLGVEVKSYHARERLLRGLKDVKEPKVGVGFFKNPAEFNYSRTITLLQATPAAIYMPSKTLAGVEQTARAVKTNDRASFNSALYRPLEQFASDMKYFSQTGKLPSYTG